MTLLVATNNLVFAFQNMVVGLGTVFLVLAFLILVISLFKYVNQWDDVQEAIRMVKAAKNGEKPAARTMPAAAPAAAAAAAAPAVSAAPAVPAGPGKMAAAKVNFADEVEGPVAAVIMAAVAEHLGGNFKVTSIKKSK